MPPRHPRFSLVIPVLTLALAAVPACGSMVWFDETNAANGGWTAFADLVAGYRAFLDRPEAVITFDDLATGQRLGQQYLDSHGVEFLNTAVGRHAAYSRIQPEGGAIVEHVTGYDGSYMPHGNPMVVKFDNHIQATPFTIVFDDPVSAVGAFVGMGVQGTVHTLTVSAYAADNAMLTSRVIHSWLWEDSDRWQNYETFFALRAPEALISRVEILNNSTVDFANGLLLDNLAWERAAGPLGVPEPAAWLFMLGGFAFRGFNRWPTRRPAW